LHLNSSGPPQDNYTYTGLSYPERLPIELDDVEMTFHESIRYPIGGPHADPEWDSLTTPSGGYFRFGPEQRSYFLTMYHEMHCLNMFQMAITMPLDEMDNPDHFTHCLNYVRQAILCSSDTTLEPLDLNELENLDWPDEFPVFTRTCKDWTQVAKFNEDNYLEFHKLRTSQYGDLYTSENVE